ncbi:Fruit bromelain [Morus notabilis]|uniref:Fruit bromelain n=1 Tax=Morus notabilis TaxID=981085 RepID=W9RK63_9ROSA|nr:Fruit bromelain [Morus notabilis]
MAHTNSIQNLIISLSSLLVLAAIFASRLGFCCELRCEETNMLNRHENWMAQHGRVYEDMEEKERRYVIFKDNVKLIEDFNKGIGQMYTLSMNLHT